MENVAGYSGTPLIKKIGIKQGMRVAVLNAPDRYLDQTLGPLPQDVVLVTALEGEVFDCIQYFVSWRTDLERDFLGLMAAIPKNGMIWISWPKKAAKMPGDLDENIVRDTGLGIGLVDVKVCAVDAHWSGLKFVYRVKDR